MEGLTLSEAFQRWQRLYLSRHRKDGGAEMARLFHRDILPVLGGCALDEIRRADIVSVMDIFILRDTPRQGKVALASLRQLFRFCIERGDLDHDPTEFISKRLFGKDTLRDRVLRDDEVQTLAKLLPLSGLRVETQTAIWLMLSTLCRVGELSRARWSDVHLESGVWRIPAEHSKNGLAHEVFLSEFAQGCFQTLRQQHRHALWCFPSRGEIDGPIGDKSITKLINDRQTAHPKAKRTHLSESLVLSGGRWTPHDLRRTGATLMGDEGVSSEVIERCLNHVEPNRMKRIYQRAQLKEAQTRAWATLGRKLATLCARSG